MLEGTAAQIQTVAGLIDTHIVSFGGLGMGEYVYSHMITIDPPTPDYDSRFLTQVALGFDAAGQAGNSANKQIWSKGISLDTLSSSGGVYVSIARIRKSLLIVESI